MPRTNRVNPFGEIVATPERGAFMGNRGLLHDAGGRLRKTWRLKRWITCLLEFKGRTRPLMAPGQYTELFFLDEATSFAAGHRPCFECRRAEMSRFRDCWVKAGLATGSSRTPLAPEIDETLHADRLGDDGRSQRRHRARLAELPDGVFVTVDGEAGLPRLIHQGRLLAWTPGRYAGPLPRDRMPTTVDVLTPKSLVETIRTGYAPAVHPSAG